MELLARNVQELAPLVDVVLLVCCLCSLGGAVRLRGCAVDELENERSSGDDTGSSGQAGELSLTYISQAMAQRWTHKSRPTMFSSTELFPLDCDPTTAIWGKSMGFWT